MTRRSPVSAGSAGLVPYLVWLLPPFCSSAINQTHERNYCHNNNNKGNDCNSNTGDGCNNIFGNNSNGCYYGNSCKGCNNSDGCNNNNNSSNGCYNSNNNNYNNNNNLPLLFDSLRSAKQPLTAGTELFYGSVNDQFNPEKCSIGKLKDEAEIFATKTESINASKFWRWWLSSAEHGIGIFNS